MKTLCSNIRSRHYPNERCKNRVVGEAQFCSKHLKNPTLFQYEKLQNTNILKIQKCWRNYISLKNFKRQGPARNSLTIPNNTTELYSLESIETIPKQYLFSFSDTNKNIWCFDIRTLSFLLSKSKEVKNPYTREVISKAILMKVQNRLKWLNERKISTIYEENVSFSQEQRWNQNVLDVFSKIEELGFLVDTEWFHSMDKEDHIDFYKKLYHLWNFILNLTEKEKKAIVPNYQSTKNKLFKTFIDEIERKDEKFLKKQNLQLIDRLISSAFDKPQKSLGCMYVLMGFYHVNSSIAESFPWLAQL